MQCVSVKAGANRRYYRSTKRTANLDSWDLGRLCREVMCTLRLKILLIWLTWINTLNLIDQRSRGCQSHPSDWLQNNRSGHSVPPPSVASQDWQRSGLSWNDEEVFFQSLSLRKGRLENRNLSAVIRFLTISVLNLKRIATIFSLCFPVLCDNLGQRLGCRPPTGMKSNHPISRLSQKQ